MNVKKFSAPTSREALYKLREAMGSDAIILSTRMVDGQIEILAMAEEDISGISAAAEKREMEARFTGNEDNNVPQRTNPVLHAQALFATKKKSEPISEIPIDLSEANYRSTPKPTETIGNVELMTELRSMRGMMESQLAEISWGSTQRREPHKAELLKELLSTGFSASLSRYLIQNMPQSSDPQHGLTWIKGILSKNVGTISSDSEMLEKGGVFALVGPTGVGKTTTTAKLAARCVMRHGASKLALITTDGYRIGGYEQLRIYGKILGVMVHTVKDEADLRIALSELKNKHTVLIDTVGMSQRDRQVSEQVAMLSGENVHRLLCLNATSTGETISEVIRSYRGAGLSGCIITKMDEAASIGAVLDAIIRQKLKLFYLANGQRVPEDLHVANKNYLVDHAFKLKREQAAFQFQDDELPLLMANATVPMNDRQLCEVSLG